MDTVSVFETSEATFEADVVDRSYEVPVVVDFWAQWCGPCRALSPVLERLAQEANGAWVLAKINVDYNPNIAQAFGVRGIPAVKGIVNGRQVAEFTGALPEPQIVEWLKQLGPSEAEVAVEAGADAEARGDLTAAREHYRRALSLDLSLLAAKEGLARIELADRVGSVDESALVARLQSNPSDVEAASGLADIALARGDHETAFRLMLDAVRDTSGDEREAARVHLLKLLDTLPPSDARAIAARRMLASLLF